MEFPVLGALCSHLLASSRLRTLASDLCQISFFFRHHYKILYLLSDVTNPCLSFLRTIATLMCAPAQG